MPLLRHPPTTCYSLLCFLPLTSKLSICFAYTQHLAQCRTLRLCSVITCWLFSESLLSLTSLKIVIFFPQPVCCYSFLGSVPNLVFPWLKSYSIQQSPSEQSISLRKDDIWQVSHLLPLPLLHASSDFSQVKIMSSTLSCLYIWGFCWLEIPSISRKYFPSNPFLFFMNKGMKYNSPLRNSYIWTNSNQCDVRMNDMHHS